MALLPFDFNDIWSVSPYDQVCNSLVTQLGNQESRKLFHIDLVENESSFDVHADLPGIKMEDVDITIENDNLLVIKGHREREYNQSDSKGRTLERHFGEYKRTIQLPNNCDKNSPRAVLNNGVLTITFPKCEPTNIRKIPLEK